MKTRVRTLAAALAAIATPLALTGTAAAETPADGREAGIRSAVGEGVNTGEIYLRWPSAFVLQDMVDRWLPAGGTARWETALSYWEGDGDSGTAFAFGPTLEYPLAGDRWRVGLGIQPTLLSDYESENRNLGGVSNSPATSACAGGQPRTGSSAPASSTRPTRASTTGTRGLTCSPWRPARVSSVPRQR